MSGALENELTMSMQRAIEIDDLSNAIEIMERIKKVRLLCNQDAVRGLSWGTRNHDSGRAPYCCASIHKMGGGMPVEIELPPEAVEKVREFITAILLEYSIQQDVDALAKMGINVVF